MKKVYKNRKKSFWGSLVGAGIGAVTGIIGSVIQAKEQEKQMKEQLALQEKMFAKQDAINKSAQNLQEELVAQQNQSIYDELRQKNYKCGGKIKARKKAEWGTEDTVGAIGGAINGLGGLLGNLFTSGIRKHTNDMRMQMQENEFGQQIKNVGYNLNSNFQNASNTRFKTNMQKYINEDNNVNFDDNKIVAQFNNKKRNMFPNKQLYM